MNNSSFLEEIESKVIIVSEKNNGKNSSTFRKKCPQCFYSRTDLNFCVKCQRDYYINRFSRWTSKDPKIDEFIRYTQINSNYHDSLEYIEWDDLDIIEYVDRAKFILLTDCLPFNNLES